MGAVRKTPLHDGHVALGAKMVWFAGWDMPIQYTTIIDEHLTVRQKVGIFDVSHMGKFLIRGKHAGLLMNTLCTNDVQCQALGRCVYSHMANDQGKVLDDTIITAMGEDEYFMVPNAATTGTMREWITYHLRGQELVDMSQELAVIALQGPKANDVIAGLTSEDVSDLKFFWATLAHLDRVPSGNQPATSPLFVGREGFDKGGKGVPALISRTGYTGEDGFEIFCWNHDAIAVWTALLDRGRQFGLKPIGLGARDTLRLEKGLLLSGTDFDGSQTSVQTGPSWVIDWKHEFVGRGAMLAQKESGSYDKLVCMITEGKGIPRHGYEILVDGAKAGLVTSGTLSPVLRRGIAMGYLPIGMAKIGNQVQIKVRDTLVPAEIVKPPFVKRD